ncbi:MAG: copper chaperone PCu(A)C [Janthinobacterium lividum]|jgi:copper(I)-binding protein
MHLTWRLMTPLTCLALLFTCALASAKDYPVGDITVQSPWSQALPPSAPTVAAYFVISNHGTFPDRLVSVDTPIAGSAQLHQHLHQDGMMKMQQLDSLQINPEEDAVFAPMSYHVMLLDLRDDAPRAEGEHFPLTLHFEKAGDVTVDVPISRAAP